MPPGSLDEAWDEIRAVRQKVHDHANRLMMVEILDRKMETMEQEAKQTSAAVIRVETKLSGVEDKVVDLVQLERGRFIRIVGTISLIVAALNVILFAAFKLLGR